MVVINEPVVMCDTQDNYYWAHGHLNKAKFKGALLSRTPWNLEGGEDADTIIHGKVKHGWLVSVSGDVSGCGWDVTMHFLDDPLPEGSTHYGERYKTMDELEEDEEEYDEEVPAEIVDGPHAVTWWEPRERRFNLDPLKGEEAPS